MKSSQAFLVQVDTRSNPMDKDQYHKIFGEASKACDQVRSAAKTADISYIMDGVKEAAGTVEAKHQLAGNFRHAASALEEAAKGASREGGQARRPRQDERSQEGFVAVAKPVAPPCPVMIDLLREVKNCEEKGDLTKLAQQKLDPHADQCAMCRAWRSDLAAWLNAAEARIDSASNGEPEEEEPEDECEFCGEDHESRNCDWGFCSTCREVLDNCSCEEPVEVSAEEFLNLPPKS